MQSRVDQRPYALDTASAPITRSLQNNILAINPVPKSIATTDITFDVLPNTRYLLALAVGTAMANGISILDQDEDPVVIESETITNQAAANVPVRIHYVYFETVAAQTGIIIRAYNATQRAYVIGQYLYPLDMDMVKSIHCNVESWYNLYMKGMEASFAIEKFLRAGVSYQYAARHIELLTKTAEDPAKGTTAYTVTVVSGKWYDVVFNLGYVEQALGVCTVGYGIVPDGAGVTFVPVLGYNKIRIFTTGTTLSLTFAHADIATAIDEIKCYLVTKPSASGIQVDY